MDSKAAFSNKAELYAKYRWDHAAEAVEAIFAIAGLTAQSAIADIGAGTGILTRHFVGRVGMIYAIEPNAEMRWFLARAFGDRPLCAVLESSAEQTGLPDHSVDLITAAQAIHWFDPEPALAEFRRILRPAGSGWLAVVNNQGKPDPFNQAIDAICTPENGVDESIKSGPTHQKPAEFYIQHYFKGLPERMAFPFTFRQDFEHFFGALCSTSFMPGAEHPRFTAFQHEAQALFDQYYPQGWREVQGETQLIIGRLA